MKTESKKKANLLFGSAMGLLLLVQMLCLLFYGMQKAGFHEDELYTYYSSNKTAGLFVNDRQWLEGEELRKEFVVLPGEQFRYEVVKQMQSWDVHPPFYYYLFHTACSLFPNVFSKWLGIGVNLIAYAASYFLLSWGVFMAATEAEAEAYREQRGRMLVFFTALAWGGSAAVISGALFIRMYQWLTLFVLLCMDLHLRALTKKDFRIKTFFLPLGITVFLGFLTQYYYLIFHFFLGAGFCLLLLKRKKIKELALYVGACAAGLCAAIWYYPASLSHIFRGYRGTEAVSAFGDLSNTWERLRFFGGLFDTYVMNHTLSLWLLALCLLEVTVYRRRIRRKRKDTIGLLLLACGGYFFTVSKTALLLGETSNRYQLPVYGILLFLIFYGVWKPLTELFEAFYEKDRSRISWLPDRNQAICILTTLVIIALTLTNAMALKGGKVFFLYEEEKDMMEFVKAHGEEPAVVFYNEASPDHIWWLSAELMACEKIYLAGQGNPEPLTDELLTESERLLVYVADCENEEQYLEGLLETNSRLSSYEVIAQKSLWTLYEMK